MVVPGVATQPRLPFEQAERLADAAAQVLASHEEFEASLRVEPDRARDWAAWETWCDQVNDPAFTAWRQALRTLRRLVGRKTYIGRTPDRFRPVCEALTGGGAR